VPSPSRFAVHNCGPDKPYEGPSSIYRH
jgi:hypothetical protein